MTTTTDRDKVMTIHLLGKGEQKQNINPARFYFCSLVMCGICHFAYLINVNYPPLQEIGKNFHRLCQSTSH